MTASIVRTAGVAALALVTMLAALPFSSDAEARRAKEHFSQTYQFDRPMNGYQGFSGDYYCSYIKTPRTVCNKAGQCKKVWELLQTCQ